MKLASSRRLGYIPIVGLPAAAVVAATLVGSPWSGAVIGIGAGGAIVAAIWLDLRDIRRLVEEERRAIATLRQVFTVEEINPVCDHAWPDELGPDVECLRCGLAYAEWTEPE